jgi:hypothetical protein
MLLAAGAMSPVKCFASIALAVAVTSCVAIKEGAKWPGEGNSGTADVLVFRDPGTHSRAIAMYVGPSDTYVVRLEEKQYAILHIPAGEQLLRVNAQGSKAFVLAISVRQGQMQCIRGTANSEAWESLLLFPLFAVIPGFKAEEVTCPDAAYLSSFTQVIV